MADIQVVYNKVTEFLQTIDETVLKLAGMKNLSPIYNKNWETDGDFMTCFKIMSNYISGLSIKGLDNLQIFEEKGITPALFFSVSSSTKNDPYTILFYSHIDKIPIGDGWTRCDPYDPKIIDMFIYGRGMSTSMYAIFSIAAVLKVLQELNLPWPNIAVLIESSFESGSPHLLNNIEKALKIVPKIDQIICLDTWGPNDYYIHYMKSCRGVISFDVKITTGQKAVHSGTFGGLIPDPMMILNNILSNKIEKIEKSEDGKATNIKIEPLELEISEDQKKECYDICKLVGIFLINIINYSGVSKLIGSKNEQQTEDFCNAYINGVLRPSYTILGYEDMPSVEDASGSLKPYVLARLCFRTPPTLDINEGFNQLKKLITENPPFGAKIEILNEDFCSGVDLEESKNNMTEKMITCFNKYSKIRMGKDILGLRLARSLPCLNYLTGKFKNVPIFMTGAGNALQGFPRDKNESLGLRKLRNFCALLACYVSDYASYKD